MFKTTALAAAASALAFAHAGNSALVAYYPVESTDTTNSVDDVIDDASHGAADATSSNNSGSVSFDATRGGHVAYSPDGHRYTAGTQDIVLADGFTWSLWWKSNGVDFDKNDPGADVIIGSRDGSWNKVQVIGTARFFDHGGYDLGDGNWHHIVYTGVSTGVDTEESTFWVDGSKISTDTSSFNNLQVENTKLEFGGASKFDEDSHGFLDDIAIWDEVLSDDDIVALFNGADPQNIPEPGSLALLGLGGLLIARRRRG